MKKILLTLILFVAILTASHAQDWLTDFTKAKTIASKEDKTIILVFQGSDWCAPCIKLDKEIWSTDTFKAYAKDHYVMLKADFPRKKKNKQSDAQAKANAQLAETYNNKGYFPFVVVLDSQGKVLGEASYQKTTPESYIEKLNAFIK